MFEEHKNRRLTRHNLPAKFGANRTTCAGYHHHLAANTLFQQLLNRGHGIPTKKVSDVDLLNIINLNLATGQIHKSRNCSHMKREVLKHLEYFFPARPSGRGNGQENFNRSRIFYHLLDMLGRVNMKTCNGPII